MTEHGLWVYVHILLFVYWLGGDLGVFILARAARRAELSFAERAYSLRMALVIDVTPRVCFALMFPVGLQICRTGGFVAVDPIWLLVAWAISLLWVAAILAAGKNHDKPLGATINQWLLVFQCAALVVLVAIGLWSLAGGGPFQGAWLGTKVLLFGLVFAMSIGIDYAFRPVVPAFMRLATEGSKPDIEAAISGSINGAILFVLGLYALLLIIAFLGVTKPF